MLYWCLLSRTSLRTHWKTCFTGVCWVELHSEHTEKTCFTGVCESNFTQNTLKNMLYWCLLSQTSLRTLKNMLYWCFWVELHSEHTEKTCFTGVLSQTSLRTLKKHALLVLSRTSLRTHWKTCFTGVVSQTSLRNTEKTCFTGVCSQTSLRTHWKNMLYWCL